MRNFFRMAAFLGASILREKLDFDDWQAHFSMQTMIIIRFRRKSRLGQLTYFDPTLGHNGPGMQARYKESVVVPLFALRLAAPLIFPWVLGLGTYQPNALFSGIFQVHAFFTIKKSGVITNSPRSIFRNVDFSAGLFKTIISVTR